MSTPVIALVGRPNVGKSTLFNCLTKTRDAIVSDHAGLTRDRQYGRGVLGEKPYRVIDTGGVEGGEEGLARLMLEQTERAIEEADMIFLIVDAKAGIMPGDSLLAQKVRSAQKPCLLIANKIDGARTPELALAEFFQLGLGEPIPVAAAHHRGITSLMTDFLEHFVPAQTDIETPLAQEHPDAICVAIVGKPNVGKSTLVNRILGEDRVIVYDLPGTTRDSIRVPLERQGIHYTLIDTAGVRRKNRVHETVEKFSLLKSLRAVDVSHVVLMVIDAKEGVSEQDMHLLSYAVDAGKSLIIALNKWDGLEKEQKNKVKQSIDERLSFVDYAKIHFISALHGTGVGLLFESLNAAYDSATRKHPTPRLTQLLERAMIQHAPPIIKGRRIKLRYAHMGGNNPPIIVLHGSQAELLPTDYQRYLINFYRKALRLVGTPIRLQLKTGENPYKHIRNELTVSQVRKRKRMMSFVKKS